MLKTKLKTKFRKYIKKFRNDERFQAFSVRFISGLKKSIFKTIRMHEIEHNTGDDRLSYYMENNLPYIIATWHGKLLNISYYKKPDAEANILLSASTDGKLMADVLEKEYFHYIAGSSSRGGGDALRQLKHGVTENNLPIFIAVDGPLGPIYTAKKGAVILAKDLQIPIFPVTYTTKRRFLANSWDCFVIPSLFDKGCVVIGKQMMIEPESDVINETEKLSKYLMDITIECESFFKRQVPQPSEKAVTKANKTIRKIKRKKMLTEKVNSSPEFSHRFHTDEVFRNQVLADLEKEENFMDNDLDNVV